MNALPLKNQMKNVFRGNQIFTKFYLIMNIVYCNKAMWNGLHLIFYHIKFFGWKGSEISHFQSQQHSS